MMLIRLLKKILRVLGIQAHRYRPKDTFEYSIRRLLDSLDVDLVIDVGANDGAYGRFLRNLGYRGAVLSFEPSSEARRALQREAAKDDNWFVAPQLAVGDMVGEAVLNLSDNSRSSSLMEMNDVHREAAPTSRYVDAERVRVSTLDRELDGWFADYPRMFLKVDVQGFERAVLAGASETLERVAAVQVELSTIELYEGQALFDELSELLLSRGFSLFCLEPRFRHPETGRLLQFDAVFDAETSTITVFDSARSS